MDLNIIIQYNSYMKIKDLLFLDSKKIKRKDNIEYKISLNDRDLENTIAFSTALHHDTYKILRELKTVQYDRFFVLRKKKGFNTIGFNINYDVIICDRNGKILELVNNCDIGYISEYYNESYFIYFTPVGTINFYKMKNNDRLSLHKEYWV